MLDYLYLKACTLARRTAETFLKYIDKNVNQLGMPLMKSRYPKNNVQGRFISTSTTETIRSVGLYPHGFEIAKANTYVR